MAKMGRPAYEPTDDQRGLVEQLSSFGVTHEHIAGILNIDQKTLTKHFDKELKFASAKANAKVANALFKQAVVEGNVTAMIFWLKTRARWKETHAVEHTGPDGKPLKVPTLADFYASFKDDDDQTKGEEGQDAGRAEGDPTKGEAEA